MTRDHPQRFVAEQRGDRFEAHAAIDGLGGEGVADLMRIDVADPRAAGDPSHDPPDVMTVQRPTLIGDQRRHLVGSLFEP